MEMEMFDTFNGKTSQVNFSIPEFRGSDGVGKGKSQNQQKNNRRRSIGEWDQTTTALQKNNNGSRFVAQNAGEGSIYNDHFNWNYNNNDISNPQIIQARNSKAYFNNDYTSYAENDKTKGVEVDRQSIYAENDDDDDNSYYNRQTRNNSETQQMSSELFANIKQMKIFKQMKDYVQTLKKNKIIQRIWFCQLNSRWTQQRSMSVSIIMMSVCTFTIVLVCWMILLIYMYRIFDDTYYPNYQANQKNQLIYSLSSIEESLKIMLKRTDLLHQIAINIYQSQTKSVNNPFYDINTDQVILKGQKNYISLKQSVPLKDSNNLGFIIKGQDLPITYDYFQWGAFKNQRNYLDISPESQQTLDQFDILSYFIKTLIGNAKLSQSFSYYCGFERDELVVYYPAGMQSSLKDMDQMEGVSFHPTKRAWYMSIVENNLQQTNQTIITLPYLDQMTNQYIMTMSTPFRDYDGNFLGVCAIDYFIENVDSYLLQFGADKHMQVAIIDSSNDQGIIITHNQNFQNFTVESYLGSSYLEWANMKQQILNNYYQNTTNNKTQSTQQYSYFQTSNGVIGAKAFKTKSINQQIFIVIVKESATEFDHLYNIITDKMYSNYIYPNLKLMIAFISCSGAYLIYSLFVTYYITQPYRDIKKISVDIVKNLQASNQIGSMMAYFNSLSFKHDNNIQNLIKSAIKMVSKIQHFTSKKILENQRFSNAYHFEYNFYSRSQMEWRKQLEDLQNYEFKKNFKEVTPVNEDQTANNADSQTDTAKVDKQQESKTIKNAKSAETTNKRSNFPQFNVIKYQKESYKVKQIIINENKNTIQKRPGTKIDQKFMNHLEEYLPCLPIP